MQRISSAKSNWWPATSSVSQGSITGSVLFSSFVNSFSEEIACTLNKLAEDTKLGGAADTLEYGAAIQGDLNKVEKWTNRKVLKITKHKCKKSCTREGRTPCDSADWGLTGWKATFLKKTQAQQQIE